MKDDIKNRFAAYFESVRTAAERAEAAEKARIQREEDGVRAFLDVAENIIKPTLREMAAYITEQGVKADVHQRGPKDTDRGVVMQHAVEVVFPESMKPGVTEPPHFKLVYNKPEQIVTLYKRTNEYNLPGDRMTLDKVTKEFLEEEFSQYFVKGI